MPQLKELVNLFMWQCCALAIFKNSDKRGYNKSACNSSKYTNRLPTLKNFNYQFYLFGYFKNEFCNYIIGYKPCSDTGCVIVLTLEHLALIS
jgi:hypothetical protein